jgi:hypothetical protein
MTTSFVLNGDSLSVLRENKIITEHEIAIQEGDIVVAKNVLTDKKRIIDRSTLAKYNIRPINENIEKTLLKD